MARSHAIPFTAAGSHLARPLKVEIDAAHSLMRNMSTTYPVALSDLLVESDDTIRGARITTAAEGEAPQHRTNLNPTLTLATDVVRRPSGSSTAKTRMGSARRTTSTETAP